MVIGHILMHNMGTLHKGVSTLSIILLLSYILSNTRPSAGGDEYIMHVWMLGTNII